MTSSVPLSLEGKLIGGCYLLGDKLGEGSYGEVFIGTHWKTGIKVAVKVEMRYPPKHHLRNETELYRTLQGVVGIPKLISFGMEALYNVLVMEKVGPNLHQLFVNCKHKLSLKTVLMLADQILTCIQVTHERGIIHCDITPGNVCMGSGSNKETVYLIDFGLAMRYRDPTTDQHKPRGTERRNPTSTLFGSLEHDAGFQQSRLDDLESIGYVLIYLLKGTLPWLEVKVMDKDVLFRKRFDVKRNASTEEVCAHCPSEFVEYMTYCHKLKFDETPDYEFLRKLFRNLFKSKNYAEDNRFDWDPVTTEGTSADDDAVKNPQPTKNKWGQLKQNYMPAATARSHVKEMDKTEAMSPKLAKVGLITAEAPCRMTIAGDLKIASPPRLAKTGKTSAATQRLSVKAGKITAATPRLSATAGVKKTGASRRPIKANDITAAERGRLAKAEMKIAAAQRRSLAIDEAIEAVAPRRSTL